MPHKENYGVFPLVVIIVVLMGILLFSIPARCQEVTQMEFRLCNGVSCSTHEIIGYPEQFKSCVIQGPIIILEWQRQNGKADWFIEKWSCYKGPRQAKM